MTFMEGARIIEPWEIKEICNEEYTNPTVERLMFIETKANEKMEGKVFPCYVESWAEAKGELLFKCMITQSMNGEFSGVLVIIRASDLGVTKRIWDKPPTKAIRNETAWMDTEVKQ